MDTQFLNQATCCNLKLMTFVIQILKLSENEKDINYWSQ